MVGLLNTKKILAPLVRSVDEVKALVAACKFPPEGQRGFGSPFAVQTFRPALPSFIEYGEQANASLLTMVQIETREALEAVEAIAPLVDVLFIGPFDLAINIGHPIRGDGVLPPALREAMARVLAAANAAGRICGIYAASPALARDFAATGYHMISVTGDVGAMQAMATEAVALARSGSPS